MKPDIVFPSAKREEEGKKKRNTKLQQMKKMVEALQERKGAVARHTYTNFKYEADSQLQMHSHTYTLTDT